MEQKTFTRTFVVISSNVVWHFLGTSALFAFWDLDAPGLPGYVYGLITVTAVLIGGLVMFGKKITTDGFQIIQWKKEFWKPKTERTIFGVWMVVEAIFLMFFLRIVFGSNKFVALVYPLQSWTLVSIPVGGIMIMSIGLIWSYISQRERQNSIE